MCPHANQYPLKYTRLEKKGVVYTLTTEIEGVTLYKSVSLEMVDNHVNLLPYMDLKKQLDATSEDVDPIVVAIRLLFQVSITLNFHFG